MTGRSKKLPRHCVCWRAPANKKRYCYLRYPGAEGIALPLPEEPNFWEEYHAALTRVKGGPTAIGSGRTKPLSVTALIASFAESGKDRRGVDGKELKPATHGHRRRAIERFKTLYGDLPVKGCTTEHLSSVLAKLKPSLQRTFKQALHALFEHAVSIRWIVENPMDRVQAAKFKSEGFLPWPETEIEKYRAYHLPGSMARLAIDLLYYAMLRRSDAIVIGPSSLWNGRLSYTQKKTGEHVNGAKVFPELLASIAAMGALPSGQAFLANSNGRPFSESWFEKVFAGWCRAAGVPKGYAPHGLRKIGMIRLAELGWSAHAIASYSGHATLKEVERYCRAADKRRAGDLAYENTVAVARADNNRTKSL
jgi:integrase